MKFIHFIIASLICYSTLYAQKNVEFEKANFKSDVAGLKTALRNLQEGDFKYNTNLYNDALIKYLSANKFNPNNADLNAKIGDCYLHSSDKSKATDYFKKAYSLSRDIDGYYLFSMGKAYHINEEFDNAIKYYRLAKSKGSRLDKNITAKADKKIKDCTYAKKLIQTPINVKIEN